MARFPSNSGSSNSTLIPRLGRAPIAALGTPWLLVATGLLSSATAACSSEFACANGRGCSESAPSDPEHEVDEPDASSAQASGGSPSLNASGGESSAGAGPMNDGGKPGGKKPREGKGGAASNDASGGAGASEEFAGGAGGIESAGGGGGDDSSPGECTTNTECDDGDPCNGAEVCSASACVPGEAPCVNPDEVHCNVACVSNMGAAKCKVSAVDGDGDGYGTPLCAQKPGNDCDDSFPEISPGAKEICDLIDNDCDSKIDLDDGLAVSGADVDVDLTAQNSNEYEWGPAIAWVPGRGHALAWVSDGGNVYFQYVGEDASLMSLTKVSTTMDNTQDANFVDVAYSNGVNRLAVIWSHGKSNDVYFKTFNGTTVDDKQNLHTSSSRPFVAATSSMWSILFRTSGMFLDDYLNPWTFTGKAASNSKPATIGNQTAWLHVTDDELRLQRIAAMESTPAADTKIDGPDSDIGSHPAIGSNGNRWGVAWQNPNPLTGWFALYDSNGQEKCRKSYSTQGNARFSVAGSANTFYVVASYDNDAIEIRRFDTSCAPIGGRGNVLTDPVTHQGPVGIAVGENSVAFAWREAYSADTDRVRVRVTGKQICD
jgi:hypothetical protein